MGDDWQSIYRFTGSDIGLFKEFDSFFGFSSISKIENTYRFNDPLLSFSSSFIKKNPNQSRKDLKGFSKSKRTEYHFAYAKQNESDGTILKSILDELIERDEFIDKKELAVLSRYCFDINGLSTTFEIISARNADPKIRYTKVTSSGIERTLSIQCMTAHKSKGLEFDIVFIINCNSGRYGFPTEINDDPLLNLLLSSADQYENGEERRLFYVAMTRAKEKVFFIANECNHSKFIEELDPGCR